MATFSNYTREVNCSDCIADRDRSAPASCPHDSRRWVITDNVDVWTCADCGEPVDTQSAKVRCPCMGDARLVHQSWASKDCPHGCDGKGWLASEPAGVDLRPSTASPSPRSREPERAADRARAASEPASCPSCENDVRFKAAYCDDVAHNPAFPKLNDKVKASAWDDLDGWLQSIAPTTDIPVRYHPVGIRKKMAELLNTRLASEPGGDE